MAEENVVIKSENLHPIKNENVRNYQISSLS